MLRATLPKRPLSQEPLYGSAEDHPDRVVPAFARAALGGTPLRVDGRGHTFDFTHLDDTTSGLCALVERFDSGGSSPPPIQLVTGVETSLEELSRLAVDLAGTGATCVDAPPRTFDVSRFVGSPERARTWLGWQPRVRLRDGLARLIADLRGEGG